VPADCCFVQNRVRKDYGSSIVVVVTMIHSPVQHLSLLRSAKKARVTDDTTPTLMPPVVTPNDILLPSDGDNNDDGNHVPNASTKHRLVVDGITGNSFSVPHGVGGNSSVNEIALFIRQTHTLFKDSDFVNRVRDINFAVTHHLTTTQRHIFRILECLKCHPRLKFLADSNASSRSYVPLSTARPNEDYPRRRVTYSSTTSQSVISRIPLVISR
jgi:hypothetical protein